jgi:ABC-type branched-subunit amino acid transport system substrate-binding protein
MPAGSVSVVGHWTDGIVTVSGMDAGKIMIINPGKEATRTTIQRRRKRNEL